MTKVIRPHDPRWKLDFESEAQLLREQLGKTLVRLHHIGSTAIPGIVAKPIVDILVEATSLAGVDERAFALEAAGYEARGEYGIEGRRYFRKASTDASRPGYHVHVYQLDSEHIARHLCFRDYLLMKPDVAQAYSALKIALSGQTGALAADYVAQKSQFIKQVERDALAYFARRAE